MNASLIGLLGQPVLDMLNEPIRTTVDDVAEIAIWILCLWQLTTSRPCLINRRTELDRAASSRVSTATTVIASRKNTRVAALINPPL